LKKSELTFQEYLKDKRDKLNEIKGKIEEKFADPEIFNDTILYEKLMADYAKISNRCETNDDEEKIKLILEEIGFEMQDYSKKILIFEWWSKNQTKTC